jgi:hypothetical protein
MNEPAVLPSTSVCPAAGMAPRSEAEPGSGQGCPDCGGRLRQIWGMRLGRVAQTNEYASCGWTGNLRTPTDVID